MGSLKDKRFRYGTFSTAMILVTVALFVFVNLIGGEFNRSFDLTQEQLFTLTRQSREFLERLDRDVTITFVSPTGQGHDAIAPIVTQLMDEYAAASSHIAIETRDPMINPAFIHEIAFRAGMEQGIPNDSVIVQHGNNVRVITPNDMITIDWHMGQPVGIRSFDFESEITRAINRVTQGEPPIVYVVMGSGEPAMPLGLETFLEGENFELREVDLVMNEVPEAADILFILTPQRDWTEVKAQRIQQFIDDEGRALMAIGFTPVDTPNLDSVLAAYGVALGQYPVIDTNPDNHMPALGPGLGGPGFIIPGITHHEILDPIYQHNLRNLLVLPISIESTAVGGRISASSEPLLMTSRAAFALTPGDDTANIPGPFELAVAVTDTRFVERQETSRFVLVGNMDIISDGATTFIGQGNYQFILSSLHWLGEQPQGIWIPSRTPPGNAPLMITRMQANTMVAVALGVIPIACLAVGIFIWLKRRHS